jgi:hypothetical protein
VTALRLAMEVPAAWPHIRALRHQVGEAMTGYPEEVRHAAMMTTSELVENAIKYGKEAEGAPERGPAPDGAPAIQFSLVVDGEHLRIEVKNRSSRPEGIQNLRACVDQIAQSRDRQALYLARMAALQPSDVRGGRLGLYRIAFEGGFDVDCSCVDDMVTVFAARKIS